MEKVKVLGSGPIEELISDVEMYNRMGEYTDKIGRRDEDIEDLVKIVKIYRSTIEKIYSQRILQITDFEGMAQGMIDEAWFGEVQAREVLSAK